MTFPTQPRPAPASFDNPDFIHLKSLSDMAKQIILWATALDAQCQILIAKRAPILDLPRPSSRWDVEQRDGHPRPDRDNPGYLPTPPRAPKPSTGGNPCDEISLESSGTCSIKAPPATKASLRKTALALGVPEALVDSPDYLGTKGRPSVVGLNKTQKLINDALDKIASGENPASLWMGPEPEEMGTVAETTVKEPDDAQTTTPVIPESDAPEL